MRHTMQEADGLHDEARAEEAGAPEETPSARREVAGVQQLEDEVRRPAGSPPRKWRTSDAGRRGRGHGSRTLKRSRITSLSRSRISARFPPELRWMATAVQKNRTSSVGVRSASRAEAHRPDPCPASSPRIPGGTRSRWDPASLQRRAGRRCRGRSGPDGARHGASSPSGNCVSNCLHPLLPLPGEKHDGSEAHDGGRRDAPEKLTSPQPSEQEAEEGTAGDIEEKVIDSPGIARLFGEAGQAIGEAGPASRPIAPTRPLPRPGGDRPRRQIGGRPRSRAAAAHPPGALEATR